MRPKKLISKHFFSFLLILSTITVLVSDQYIKHKIRQTGGFYLCNQGISFGIKIPTVIFWLIFTVLVLLSLKYYKSFLKKNPFSWPFFVVLGLFIGGVLSNLIDRLFFGCIFDYIDYFGKIFPVFNIADVAIFVASCLFIFLIHTKTTTNC